MSDGFAAPGSMTGLEYAEMQGHLLVVEPVLYEPKITTTMGDKDAIRANVIDVTDQTVYDDVLIFPRVLVSSLRGRLGQKVLATLSQGQGKPGQNPPWILVDASGDKAAVAQATAYLNSLKSGQFSAPASTPGTAAVTEAQAKANLTSIFGGSEVAAPF